jgi:pyridoxine 5-phosphate synthase
MDREIQRIYTTANHAVKAGVKVSAGHGLDYSNIAPVLKARALEEVNIGHSIVSRSIFVGLSQAVAEMIEVLE